MSTSPFHNVDYWDSISLAKKELQYKKGQSFRFWRTYTKPKFCDNLKRDVHGSKKQVEMLDLEKGENAMLDENYGLKE